jgi:hypothetical protein
VTPKFGAGSKLFFGDKKQFGGIAALGGIIFCSLTYSPEISFEYFLNGVVFYSAQSLPKVQPVVVSVKPIVI